jgi:uncharacterized protein (TIGR04255 family)
MWLTRNGPEAIAMAESSTFNLDFSESFPHLEHAPVIEAVIHWQARISQGWEPTEIQQRLAELVKDYPHSAPQRIVEFETVLGPDRSPSQSQREHWQGLRLTSPDRLQIVQFLRDGLVFSRLRPYTEWASFSTEAIRLWRVFVELGAPKGIERLGVRFINRVELSKADDFRNHLASPPDCLEPFGFPLTGFLYQSTHDVLGYPFRINVVRAIQPSNQPEELRQSLIVDIDVFTTKPLECRDEVVNDHLTKMRWLKDKAFFSLFRESAIKTFGETHDRLPA